MSLWDSRPKEQMFVFRSSEGAVKRYRHAKWTFYTDRGDWRVGVRLKRQYGDAEINLPMVQLVREGWYASKDVA